MKFCPDCGCENLEEAQFCRNCGLKFDVEVQKTTQNVTKVNDAPEKNAVIDNPIISGLFYKTDKYTGDLRIAKAKTISIVVFVVMFIFCTAVNIEGGSLLVLLLASLIFGLMFAIPTYVIGYILGIVVDRMSH